MRKLATIVTAVATVAVLAAPPSLASTQAHSHVRPMITCFPCTGYLRDGNGAGDAASVFPNIGNPDNQALFPEPVSVAWRWDMYDEGTVPHGTFSYGPLANATANDDWYIFTLFASQGYCMTNSTGGAASQPCVGTRDQEWVFDPPTGYWINVGRSNDKNNWEILCNPGSSSPSGELTVTTRDNCSDYHEEWAFNGG